MLVRVVLQCYYRDDRVLRSLGLELRAPFPKGYMLEQGDWSLLDPVKARPATCGGRIGAGQACAAHAGHLAAMRFPATI